MDVCSTFADMGSRCHSSINPSIKVDGSCFQLTGKYGHSTDDNFCYTPDDHCHTDGMTYSEAENKCAQLGGRLAVLNTGEKIDKTIAFIKRKVAGKKKYAGNYWIGASANYEWNLPIGR